MKLLLAQCETRHRILHSELLSQTGIMIPINSEEVYFIITGNKKQVREIIYKVTEGLSKTLTQLMFIKYFYNENNR